MKHEIRQASIPLTITEPGEYVVVEDLVCPPGDVCITVASRDVDLDLGGHRIVMQPIDKWLFVQAGTENIRIYGWHMEPEQQMRELREACGQTFGVFSNGSTRVIPTRIDAEPADKEPRP